MPRKSKTKYTPSYSLPDAKLGWQERTYGLGTWMCNVLLHPSGHSNAKISLFLITRHIDYPGQVIISCEGFFNQRVIGDAKPDDPIEELKEKALKILFGEVGRLYNNLYEMISEPRPTDEQGEDKEGTADAADQGSPES